MTIKLEIVTPVFNRLEETRRCLESIAVSRLDGIDVNITIVDDGSTDGTYDVISREFPYVHLIKGNGSLWYTAGTNRGIEAALKREPDYILAINNDSVFAEDCIINMIECAGSHTRSVVGAVLIDREIPEKVFQVAPRWELLKGGYRHWNKQTISSIPQKPWKVDVIVGNCVLYPVAAIREAGLMNEKLVQYGDAEYTPRMRRLGWQLLIEPRSHVFCKPNDVITGFRNLSVKEKLKRIFSDPSGPYSIHRRLYSSMGAAPNKFLGVLAVPIFYIRVLLGISQEGAWGMSQPEAPLSEVYRSAIVDD